MGPMNFAIRVYYLKSATRLHVTSWYFERGLVDNTFMIVFNEANPFNFDVPVNVHGYIYVSAEIIIRYWLGSGLLSAVPDYFGRNKISSGSDLSHYSSASLY